jgi:hypothetical protein
LRGFKNPCPNPTVSVTFCSNIKAVDDAGCHYRSSPTLLGGAYASKSSGWEKDTDRGDYDFPTIPLEGDALSLRYDDRVELVRVLHVEYSANRSHEAPPDMTLVVDPVAWAD